MHVMYAVDILYTLYFEHTQPRITCRFILLGLVAIARDAFFLGEQPSSSLMTDFPYMLFMASVVAPLYWSKVSLSYPQLLHNIYS